MEPRKKIKLKLSGVKKKSKRKKNIIKRLDSICIISFGKYVELYSFTIVLGIKINYKHPQKQLMSTTDIYYPSQHYYLENQPSMYAPYQQIYTSFHPSILPYVDNSAIVLGNMGKYSGQNNKVKTSLCKKWAEFGTCPYLHKCQFAHGIQELRCNVDENSYKTKNCNAFFKKGYCPYGFRCNFSHKGAQMTEDSSLRLGKQTSLSYYEILKVATKQEAKSRLFECFLHKMDESDSKSITSTQDCRSESLSKSRLGYTEEKIEEIEPMFIQFSSSTLDQPVQIPSSPVEGEQEIDAEVNQSLLSFNIDHFC